MLRRRIVVPALSTTKLQAVEVSKRHTRQPGRFQQISYLPPGNHAPRMPWICEAVPQTLTTKLSETPHETTLECTATKVGTAKKMTVPSVFESPTDLDAILNTSTVAERTAALAPRAVVETCGVLQSTAAQTGPLRVTSACRMPALSGPTLDTRIGDILKVGESLAAEMLPDVVRLLIDPNAEGVESVSLSDFAAMQPRRQLAALGGKKPWHEWLIESAHYKQVARLELESPLYDLRALRQAGITTLYQWAEQPDLVKVSAYTRSLLDAAVEKSVEAYVDEVIKVVNTSNRLADLLVSWVADTVGKFILETLQMTVEQAAAQRGAVMSGATTSVHAMDMAVTGETATEMAAIAAMDTTTSPGRACTLEHFHRLAKKILLSVRKEYMAQRQLDHGGNDTIKTVLDSQAEAEIREKAYITLSDALLKVLEVHAQNMPKELHPLRDNGFLALERLPGLLRQAASVLQLQNVPVRYFVFHSTGDREMDELATNNFNPATMGGHDAQTSGATTNSSMNVAAPTLMSGVFLAGTANYNITLGEWTGNPQPNSAPSSVWTENTVQNEYFSVLHRLKRHTIRVARTSLYDTIKGADEFRNGFNAAEALGLQQLFGTAKLVEDRLASALNCHSTASPTFKPLHFVEAGHSCGKTSMLERLFKRMLENKKKSVIVRYSGAGTPFTPGLDDHPLAFPARFWFRVALASCPYLVRTEELFTRAPKSVMWWANRLNWSWELYQKRILLYSYPDGVASPLHAILIDDIDRALDAMEGRLTSNTATAGGMLNGEPGYLPSPIFSGDVEEETRKVATASSSPMTMMTAEHNNASKNYGDKKKENAPHPTSTAMMQLKHYIPFQPDIIESALAKITVAIGQLDMVFTGHRTSKLFLTYADAPIRRYFIPLSNGIGLQQRLRVFPLVSVLYALHQRSRLEFSGLMYEVLKNCPGLLGHTLDVFWSGRAALMDLRGGAPRLMQWSGTHPLLRSYVPAELFAELPQRNYLLQNLPEARLRLVELLQRQLSSPTGYLATGVETTVQDERDGLVVPYNHTTCQVHPFALFTIFTHQDPLESPRETMVVRAWGEVWAEYCAIVSTMGTTNERKRDALRVLLHGALLLRVVAVSGAKMDLNLKIPPYGFPLLASPTRVKPKGSKELMVVKATADTVRKAAAAYKSFFMQTEQTYIPFRPSVGLNGGCDVVSISGATLALYDLVTTPEALQDINYRFAEALLGVLHCLGKNVLPQHKIRQIHYVSVVSIDQSTAMTSHSGKVTVSGNTTSSIALDDVFALPPASIVPYFLDLSAVFEDDVIDRLRALQETLDISKEFRTLNDLLDELESVYNVHVHQDVVASQEELESLLSTTLMQLVPDATVLPAYTAEVVSPDTLLMDLLVDEEEEEGFRGAEVEEVHRDTLLAKEVSMPESFADAEHMQESAELLEALLNESFVDTRQQSAQEKATNESTQVALLTDIATEDAINNNMPVDTDVVTARQATLLTSTTNQEDALAWLHDIVTPATTATSTTNLHNEKGCDLTVTTKLSSATSKESSGGRCAFVSLNSEEVIDSAQGAEEEEKESGNGADDYVVEKQTSVNTKTSSKNKNNSHHQGKTRNSKGNISRERSRQQRLKLEQSKIKKLKKSPSTLSSVQTKRKAKKTKKNRGKTTTSYSSSSTTGGKKKKKK